MINHISIDVTDAIQSAVSKEKFKIVNYDFGNGTPFEDLVHDSVPYLHFQILRPKDEEQRDKALSYFKEHGKLYVAFVNSPDILLYIGCTESVYIKSAMAEVKPEEFKSLMAQAAHWYRFYGSDVSKE
jgi:hypothetical protein